MKQIIALLAVQLCTVFGVRSYGQDINARFEAGAALTGFVYHGDLSENRMGHFKDMCYGVMAFGKYYVSPITALRLNLYHGSLRGNDADFSEEWRRKRAYEFRSPVTELSLLCELDLFGKRRFESFRDTRRHFARFGAYVLAGAGVAFTQASRSWANLDRVYFYRDAPEQIGRDSSNKPASVSLVVPLGLGGRYDISKRLTVFAEAGYRFTLTDNMDGYKYSVYSSKYDGYTTYSFGISYRFDKDTRYRRQMLLQ